MAQRRDEIDLLATRLRTAMRNRVAESRHRLGAVKHHETFRRPLDRIHRWQQVIDDRERALVLAISTRLKRIDGERLRKLETRLALRHPRHLVRLFAQKLTTSDERLHCAIDLRRQHDQSRVTALDRQLNAVSPLAVLRRGYSVTLIKKTGTVVRNTAQITGGERLITRLSDGQIESTADDPRQPKLFE